MRATWKSVLWLFVGGFAVAVMWLLGAVAAHAQPTCTDSWANAVSGQWNTASNWSQNRVPASTDDVCITVPGTYTVTLNGGGSAGMLNLGAGSTTSGTQTLDVQGTASGTASNLTLSTSTGSDVALGGVLELDSQQGAGAGTAELGGGSGVTLVNDGTFETLDATNNSDQIAVNLTNDSGGKVSIAGASTDVNGQNAAMTITNSGSFTVTSAGDLSLNEGSNFTDKAGTLVNDGTMTVSGTFTQSGGVESANAVQFQENATLADSAGAGSFSFLANSGAFLSGTIPASQTVTVTGNSTTSAAANLTGNVTNDGTFVLDADGGSASLSGGSGVTFTNKGTFETEGTSTSVPDQIATELTNDSGGTVSIAAPVTVVPNWSLTVVVMV